MAAVLLKIRSEKNGNRLTGSGTDPPPPAPRGTGVSWSLLRLRNTNPEIWKMGRGTGRPETAHVRGWHPPLFEPFEAVAHHVAQRLTTKPVKFGTILPELLAASAADSYYKDPVERTMALSEALN